VSVGDRIQTFEELTLTSFEELIEEWGLEGGRGEENA